MISSFAALGAVAMLTACGGAAPGAPSNPTVQAVVTQAASTGATAVSAGSSAAGTAQAAASPVVGTAQALAPTAQAGAANAAGTAQALAPTAQAGAASAASTAGTVAGTAGAAISPLASPSPSPRPAAGAPVRIADASLADATPWLSVQNTTGEAVDLGGWRVQVGAVSAELPDEAVVEPNGTLTLHAGTGSNSDDELFLGDDGNALASAAMPGAPVRLTDARGQVVTEVIIPRF